MGKYVLGFDGGGTKTHCALADFDGNIIDFVELGPTNYDYALSNYDVAFNKQIRKTIGTICERNRISVTDIVRSVFGIHGADTKGQCAEMSDLFGKIGLRDFVVVNDAFLGIKAGFGDGYGICSSCGTGFVVGVIDRNKKMMQIGGMGDFTGDDAGGTFLRTSAISSVYQELFRCGEKTLLTEMLFKKLDISSKYDFFEKVFYETNKNHHLQIELCSLSKDVFCAAEMGDKVCTELIIGMAKNMSKSIIGAMKEPALDFGETINIVFSGSVSTKEKNPLLNDTLKSEIQICYPEKKFNFKILDVPPVAGAILWAMEGVEDTKDFYEKVTDEFCNREYIEKISRTV